MSDRYEKSSAGGARSDDLLQSLFRAATMSSHQGIKPRPDSGPVPLSASQKQMWFLNQINPESPVYNTFRAFHVTGDLDLKILHDSIREIVMRHDSLRTVFRLEEGIPSQIIKPDMEFDFTFKDLGGTGDDGADSSNSRQILGSLLVDEARRTLDLLNGPCLRIFVYRLQENEYCFQLVLHHSFCDGWSLSTFFRELADLYEAYSSGKPSPLQDLPIQYADYSVWQNQWLEGGLVTPHLEYWQDQLRGLPGGLNLPADYPRPHVQSFQGGIEEVIIPAKTVDRLKRFSSEEGVTLFMTLLAAYQVLLHRYSGQDDIVTGSPIANRNHPETYDLIGCFVNTLALRTDLSGFPSFREVVSRVRKMTLDAYAHQDLPFQVLVEKVQSRRDMTFTPLFQASFVLQNMPDLACSFSGLTFTPLRVDNLTAKYDINLLLREYDGELKGKLEYSTDLFRIQTVKRFINHFHVLLDGVLTSSDRPVSEVPLLTDSERQKVLFEWNNGRVEFPAEKCLHHLLEERAAETPDAVAVVYGNDSLTYNELNNKANQLAYCLKEMGVGPEALVCICMERSLQMVTGILAILKAGGAYVPLDPAYPPERIDFIVEDTGALLLLTQEALLGRFQCSVDILCIDRDRERISGYDRQNPVSNASPDSAAYVIYTSGSTGTPKGVVVEHRNVVRLFEGTEKLYQFDHNDVWTLFHSIAFDFSVWELWGALLYGGRLVIVPYTVSRSADEFYDLLINERVTVLNITPSVFREIIEADRRSAMNGSLSLRYIIFGGEELKTSDLKPWYELHDEDNPRLVNMYGITETTVHVTYRILKAEYAYKDSGSLIGQPISDLSIYLLDRNMQPLPVGVPGEIYVGGAGVAREYLGRPDLTEERFVPDIFSNRPGARLYKSGDLGKYLHDGNIEYAGRIDHQVKIRGYRIELGEIESVIGSYHGVRDAILVAREFQPGDKRLIAYVLQNGTEGFNTDELKDFLKGVLPDYMVPSALVLMDSFPLNANGKINRKALPDPFMAKVEQEKDNVLPQSSVEEELIRIWHEIFEIDGIGRDDDFFEIGGHSLLAMRLIAWVRRDLQVELSIHNVFEYPTIAGLASIIEKK